MRIAPCRLATAGAQLASLLLVVLLAASTAGSSTPAARSAAEDTLLEVQSGPAEALAGPEWAQLRRQIEAARDAVVWEPDAVDESDAGESWRALNRSHGLDTRFDEHGINVRSSRDGDPDWELSLRLIEYGYQGAMVPSAAADPQGHGRRVRYERGELTEWFVNESRGLEQGWTLQDRPKGPVQQEAGSLTLRLAVTGSLSPAQATDTSAHLVDGEGEAVLRYGGLVAWDATGAKVPATMQVSGSEIRILVQDGGAVYPLTIDPWMQQAKLTAADAAAGDNFGVSVAISGDTAIVGANFDDDAGSGSGSAYVFDRNQGGASNWGQVKKLTAADAAGGDRFGISVAISGDTAVVGAFADGDGGSASGSVYVFDRNQGGADNWGQVKKLTAGDAAAGDNFGISVAISGDTAVVGGSARRRCWLWLGFGVRV